MIAAAHPDLVTSHGTETQGSLAAMFEEVRASHGSRTAVSMGQEEITFAELGAKSDAIAEELWGLGLQQRSVVAIYLERSIDLVAAMLGVVKAGMAYLPLDPGYPSTRTMDTLADAAPGAVITSRTLSGKIQETTARFLLVEDALRGETMTRRMPTVKVVPDDLAYIIYTSGSTGKPKGVMVSHSNVMRLFTQTERWFHFNKEDVWTMFHSFSFDFSVWEMWGPLLTGGRLVIVPFVVSRSPEDFYTLLADEGVTVLNQTPSAFSLLMQSEARTGTRPLALRVVIFGGESLNLRSLRPWFERHGDRRPELINMYGITETTVHVTYRRVSAEDAEQETDSLIGEPIPDLQLRLLDGELRPVAEGETGEICVGGAGVALGYLNRPELTRERFAADPFASYPARLYRSGDLARRREDGELVYLGRADRQVKINGFRIELGEIEATLMECAGVSHACVLAHADPDGTQRLAAYFVPTDEATTAQAVSRFLAERLPAHMRPAFYLPIVQLPLNANGKIDRDALPPPDAARASAAASPQAILGANLGTNSGAASGPNKERRVLSTWQGVLNTPSIGLDDNFFDIGGTSLLLIAVRTALAVEFKMTIPITWMFEYTTVRTLSAKLSETSEAPLEAAIPTGDGGGDKAQRQRASFARARAMRRVAG